MYSSWKGNCGLDTKTTQADFVAPKIHSREWFLQGLKSLNQLHDNSSWYVLHVPTLDVQFGSGVNSRGSPAERLFIISWFTPRRGHGAPQLLPEATKLDTMLEDGTNRPPPPNGQEHTGLHHSHPKHSSWRRCTVDTGSFGELFCSPPPLLRAPGRAKAATAFNDAGEPWEQDGGGMAQVLRNRHGQESSTAPGTTRRMQESILKRARELLQLIISETQP